MTPPRRTILTIVRHGQTSANLEGVWHGSTNTALTTHGRRQAEAAGDWIHGHHRPIQAVYASPLDRAHHTAQAIGARLELEPRIDPDLAEYDLGSWEGIPFQTLWEEKRLFQNMKADPHYRPHGGESPKQVGDRLAGALRRIAARHPGERAVVVSHGGALSIAFGLLIDNDYGSWGRMMKNCAISELVLDPRPELLSFNHTAHLPSEEPRDEPIEDEIDQPPEEPDEGRPARARREI
jgi:broad specificity phosphatase PhoE